MFCRYNVLYQDFPRFHCVVCEARADKRLLLTRKYCDCHCVALSVVLETCVRIKLPGFSENVHCKDEKLESYYVGLVELRDRNMSNFFSSK